MQIVYNHDLRNQLGNLLARVTTPRLTSSLAAIDDFFSSSLSATSSYENLSYEAIAEHTADVEIHDSWKLLQKDVDALMEDFEFSKALERVLDTLAKVSFRLEFGLRQLDRSAEVDLLLLFWSLLNTLCAGKRTR